MKNAVKPAWRAVGALALPFVYMMVIFWLSSLPGGSVIVSVSDKILHTVEYAGLSFCLFIGLHYGLNLRPSRAAGIAILLAITYGASDELHQSFVPGRDMSILDWFADLGGATLAQLGLYVLRVVWRKKTAVA